MIKGLLLVTLYLLQKTPDNFHSLHPPGWFIPITISCFTRRVRIYQIYIFKIFYFYYFVQPYYFIFISLYLVTVYVIHDNTNHVYSTFTWLTTLLPFFSLGYLLPIRPFEVH